MSLINKFLEWMMYIPPKTTGDSDQYLWKNPALVNMATGYFFVIFGLCGYNIVHSYFLHRLVIVGILQFVLSILSMLNWEYNALDRYKWFGIKIF